VSQISGDHAEEGRDERNTKHKTQGNGTMKTINISLMALVLCFAVASVSEAGGSRGGNSGGGNDNHNSGSQRSGGNFGSHL